MAHGFVYILINPAMPGLLKIGKTTGSSEARAAELSAVTGLPAPFVVAYEWNTIDCDTAESHIHERLATRRYSKDREFFSLPLKEAIEIVSSVCQQFPSPIANQRPKYRLDSRAGIASVAFSCQNCHQKYSVSIRFPEKEVTCPNCHTKQPHLGWW